ncbi:heat shock protein transcriptional repressor HspR [Aquipuribacter sp. MA13-6]|uniref:heat shock protein transcriptional repressor HspR n=1 Tax=unclassified Aquipuribacter TaxID=2635084 RepID=UPI003EE8CC14
MSERVLRRAYVISVAAELAGMHPQTLRQYDREGLVIPTRTSGGGRRYTDEDIERLREVQRLSQEEGVNLAGIRRILELEEETRQLRGALAETREELRSTREAADRVFAAGSAGDIVALAPGRRPQRRRLSTALVVWSPGRRD